MELPSSVSPQQQTARHQERMTHVNPPHPRRIFALHSSLVADRPVTNSSDARSYG